MTSQSTSTTSPTEDRDEEEPVVDEEELLAQLDDQFELSGLRERRIEELRQEMSKNQKMAEEDHGRYVEIKDEKQVIQITAKAELSVVHFFHQDFEKCKTMDKKLEELSAKYFSTRFLRANVANVPWLVTKLQVQVLPCVVGFVNGILKERIVGFDGITGLSSKEINPLALESRLRRAGVIQETKPSLLTFKANRSSVSAPSAKRESDEESDWDD